MFEKMMREEGGKRKSEKGWGIITAEIGVGVEILNRPLANVSPFTFHTFIIALSY